MALAVLGVISAYVKNGGTNGTGLIQKFVVLGWVVTICCLLGFIPIMIAIYFIADLPWISEETGWIDVLVVVGFEAVIYQRIGKQIADTRKRTSLGTKEP